MERRGTSLGNQCYNAFEEMLTYQPEDLGNLYLDDIVVADRQEIESTQNR